MSALILVATPHIAFGELLRISLEDSAQYQVRLVQSAKEARTAAAKAVFQLAILDTALSDEPFVPLCFDLLQQQSGIRLVVIPPDNNPNHPALGGLIPHGYLSRPFYLPDLLDLVSRLLADREKQIQAQSGYTARAISGEHLAASMLSVTLPPWLQEPITLRGYLEKELGTTQALSAMAGMNGSQPGTGTLRASAGILDDESAQELVSVVFRYWNRAEKTDLMRFVRLSTDKKDYLVYATQIVGDLVLILAYDNAAPLSQIRPQTKSMAQALAALPPDDYRSGKPLSSIDRERPEKQEPAVPQAPSSTEASAIAGANAGANAAESVQAGLPQQPPSEPAAIQPVQDAGPAVQPLAAAPTEAEAAIGEPEEEEEIKGDIINLSALLGSVPAPDPERDTAHNAAREAMHPPGGWVFDRSAAAPIPTLPGGMNGYDQGDVLDERGLEKLLDRTARSQAGEPTAPSNDPPEKKKDGLPHTAPLDPNVPEKAAPRPQVDFANYPTAPSGRPASLEVDTEPPVKPVLYPNLVDSRPVPVPQPETDLDTSGEAGALDETRPHIVTAVTSLSQLEPVSPALSLLNYTCVLVPRMPQHYLTGELADKLAGWVQQLCLAFGWRLEGISIRPEYLQWTVQVVPAISPGNLVRIIRQRTSQHIFSAFSHLATLNPSGDFWAAGYLIVSGAQPPSAQLLRDYIAQTRKRQGINK